MQSLSSRLARLTAGAMCVAAAVTASPVGAAEPGLLDTAELEQAYARALLVGRVTGDRALTVATTDVVTDRAGIRHDDAELDIAGPPAAPPPTSATSAASDLGRGDGRPDADSGAGPDDGDSSPAPDDGATVSGDGVIIDGQPTRSTAAAALLDRLPTTVVPPQPTGDGWVCPVPQWTWFTHDWGFPRSGGRTHKGNDIFAPAGSPLLAATSGVVVKVRHADRGLGGRVVSYLNDDGYVIYNAHLNVVAADVQVGDRIAAGRQLGTIGNSGNARTTPPHLHIGVYESWTDRAVDPYPWTSRACRR